MADLDGAFTEFRRVLRPGGHAILYQMTATDWLTPAEADRLWPVLGVHAASVDATRFEAAIATGGLTLDQRIELRGEWRERSDEDQVAYRGSRQLLHASRLPRNRRHYGEQFSTAAYDAMLASSLRGVYQMIGKLNPRVYVLSRGQRTRRGATPGRGPPPSRDYRGPMASQLVTDRLVLRPWQVDDAPAALRSYGDEEVARWLSPTMDQVTDEGGMRVVLQQWIAEDTRMLTPAGRWAIELRDSGELIGGATLLPLPPDDEYEMGWQLERSRWGNGYATEAGTAVAQWAFGQGLEQVIALVRPTNSRAESTVRRLGMEWVGETEKYHHLRLQEFRLRPADLGDGAAAAP